jgi:hypothetical protein
MQNSSKITIKFKNKISLSRSNKIKKKRILKTSKKSINLALVRKKTNKKRRKRPAN